MRVSEKKVCTDGREHPWPLVCAESGPSVSTLSVSFAGAGYLHENVPVRDIVVRIYGHHCDERDKCQISLEKDNTLVMGRSETVCKRSM